jgi:hypothetical protein
MHDVPTLGVIQTLVVDARQPIDDADMPGLRDERLVVHEPPQRDKAVEASGLLIVAEDASNLQHGPTVISTGACLSGSYRERNRDDDSRIRSICGSRFVVHSANTYRLMNINRPARNE